MNGNDNNTGNKKMNATQNNMLTKLQAFADTLDLYRARVELGTGDRDRGVVWLKWNAYGMTTDRKAVCGLVNHGIRYIKKQMKEVEASVE